MSHTFELLSSQLLSLADAALEVPPPSKLTGRFMELFLDSGKQRVEEWKRLLSIRNGFYAFDHALLFRPIASDGDPLGAIEWNAPEQWKLEYYIGDLKHIAFFAEDVFGSQYCIFEEQIGRFDPETGELSPMCKSFEEWISIILEDTDFETGRPMALAWQEENGCLSEGHHLVPKLPFVLGGKYETTQLYSMPDVQSMRFRADIAVQLRGLHDGQEVTLKINTRS